MSSTSDPGLERILAAALTLFGRHGFQRTSMAEVAREAKIARATLYLRFSDKRALFAALAAALVDDAIGAATAAWSDGANLAHNVAATLLSKDLAFWRLLNATPHGAELLEVDADLTASHVARLDALYIDLLTKRAEDARAQGADLAAFGGAAGFATFLATTGSGLKHEIRAEEEYRAAIDRLALVTARAAGLD